MTSIEFFEKIRKVDWNAYGGQDYFNPAYVPVAFEQLFLLNSEPFLEEVSNNFLNAIGNNHRGTYYPVTIQAIEFILMIAINGESEISRFAALEILILLYCTFCAENANYKLLSREEIENKVDKMIESYKLKFQLRLLDTLESNRNKETLAELLESIEEKENNGNNGQIEE